MIVDSSAILAILLNEHERANFIDRIQSDSKRMISAASLLGTATVLEGRLGDDAGADLDLFILRAGIESVPFDGDQYAVARHAFRRYGKGRHPAGLNFGDCIAYALAKCTGEPLLFKGTDIPATDVLVS
jgi:ribonuclease VapC